MKTPYHLVGIALIALAAGGLRAQTVPAGRSAEEMRAEAIAAARAADQNGAAGTRGFGEFKGTKDPALVEAEARGVAAAPDQNVASGSKVNSKVISTMPAPDAVTAGK